MDIKLHKIALKNNERLALLKMVNNEIWFYEQKGATVARLTLLYSLQKQLKKRS